MPTQQVIAMLKATKPAQAASVLLSMPSDRITLLMAEMEPTDINRMMLALTPSRRSDVLAVVPPQRRPLLFRQLSMRQFADLLSVVSTDIAAQMLSGVSPAAAAELLSDLGADTTASLLPLLDEGQQNTVAEAMYKRQARESVVRAAANVKWYDQSSCDLAAQVFDRWVHVAIRFLPGPPPGQVHIDGAAGTAQWSAIAGMLVVTNADPAEAAVRRTREYQQTGRRLELLRWTDGRDDGALKRALVRLAS